MSTAANSGFEDTRRDDANGEQAQDLGEYGGEDQQTDDQDLAEQQQDQQVRQRLDPSTSSPLSTGRANGLQRTDRIDEQVSNEKVDTSESQRAKQKLSQKMALDSLRQAIAEQDESKINQELEYIESHYPELETSPEVIYAYNLAERLEQEREFRKLKVLRGLRLATYRLDEKKIREKLINIEDNFPDLCEQSEYTKAKNLLERLEVDREASERSAIERVREAVEMRDEKSIREELRYIDDYHPELKSREQVIKDANKLLKKIEAGREINLKVRMERLRKAVQFQDETKIRKELLDIQENCPELANFPAVKDANELLRILAAARRLKENCIARSKSGIRAAIDIIKEDEIFKESLKHEVREAESLLKDLKKRRRAEEHPLKIDKYSLNELRRFSHPPPGVLQVMQAVLLLLGEDEESTETWQDVQRLCKPSGPLSLHNRVLRLEDMVIQPEIAARAKELLLGEDWQKRQDESRDRGTNVEDVGHVNGTEETGEKANESAGINTPRGELDRKYNALNAAPNTAQRKGFDQFSQDPKTIGIDFERLQKSSGVAATLYVWAMVAIKKVEERDGAEAMNNPARDPKQQRKIFERQRTRFPKINHDPAKPGPQSRDPASQRLPERGPPPPRRKVGPPPPAFYKEYEGPSRYRLYHEHKHGSKQDPYHRPQLQQTPGVYGSMTPRTYGGHDDNAIYMESGRLPPLSHSRSRDYRNKVRDEYDDDEEEY